MSKNYTEKRPTAVVDTECLPNYWSIEFRCVDTGRTRLFEKADEFGMELDTAGIAKLCRNWRIVTFNGSDYDIPMICLAMSGVSNAELKHASDEIIQTNLRSWEFLDKYELKVPPFLDHIDLFNVAPAAAQMVSLKGYAGRLHSKRIVEMPFKHDHWLTRDDIASMRNYLGTDTVVTAELLDELKEQVELRAFMSQEHGIDVRSKSDAQVAEAVIKSKVEQLNGGRRVYKPDIEPGFLKYVAPAYIKFETPALQEMLSTVLRTQFRVRRDGYVDMPDELKKLNIEIAGSTYQMGIGGLHSQEESISHYSDDEFVLSDNDVNSYYPNLIIASGRFPKNMGKHFQTVYREIVSTRIAAKKKSGECKKAGNKEGAARWAAIAESMKIMTNGSFGKTGSPYSVLYSPDLLLYTTLTGQLSILMLIEQCEMRGWNVVSANTDGFVTYVPRADYDSFRALITEWEWDSGLTTEETIYKSLHSRDVNNYFALAVEHDNSIKIKRKGAYAESGRGVKAAYGLKKNPDMDVCIDAVMEFLKNGTAIESTIRNCQDIRKFVIVQKVNVGGGAYKDGEFVGKNVRYYYGDDTPGPLLNGDGGRVGSSDGACPCMELPDELPDNIDYERYEREAYAILRDIGVPVDDPAHRGRSGFALARLPDQKTFHTVDLATGRALCGVVKKTLREPWVEVVTIPEGHKHCAKCRKADDL
jgi:hypothetical protein